MRVSTAFNRLLQISGAWVTDVVIGERDVEVTLRNVSKGDPHLTGTVTSP